MSLGLLLSFLTFVVPFGSVHTDVGVVAAADGVPIHYSVQGKGEPTLVFVHCGGCDQHVWDNQVSVFSKNQRVVTIDLAGHGKSGEGRKNWSVESFADDVNSVITKLKIKRVILVGSSMGGPIVLEATRRMPERVVAIVPVDALHNVENKLSQEQLDAVFKELRADYKGTMTGFLNQMLFSPSTPAAVRTRITSEVTSRPPETAIAILQGVLTYDSVPALKEVKVPIHAINADMNPTNLEVNRKYAPQFEAVIIKGSGHYPMLEDPSRFNELLMEYLQQLKKAPAKQSIRQ